MTETALEELQGCFKTFYSILLKASPPSGNETISLSMYKNAFSTFVDILERSGFSSHPNIFELCALNRDEVKNCRVLAWWLDKNTPHGLGCRFLEKILIATTKPGIDPLKKCVTDASYSTRTEICPNGDNSDRVDIVCESSKILIYIEVKIDSIEHNEQTERYYKRLLKNAAGRQYDLIFISPNVLPVNNKARFVSWKKIGEIARSLVDEASSDFIRDMLEQYGKFVREF